MTSERVKFEHVASAFQGEIAHATLVFTHEPRVRSAYQRATLSLVEELRSDAMHGRITWASAAQRANEARNVVLNTVRSRSTPIGRAIAETLKRKGRTLNELIARYTVERFGPTAIFERLSPAQKNAVYAQIVDAAARTNPSVNAEMLRWSRAGRGLMFLSLAVSIYSVVTAEDHLAAAGREVAITGAGIVGGVAGGALAGLACGPGAPVCVTIGAFVGGAVAAMSVDLQL